TIGEEGAKRLGRRLYPPLPLATQRGRDSFSAEDKGRGKLGEIGSTGETRRSREENRQSQLLLLPAATQ
ncbi:hypothetical protein U1Q18_014828, partial [Sarracenia purpurea var. burkii]